MYLVDYTKSVGELGQVPQTESQGLPTPLAIMGAIAVIWIAFKFLK